MSSTEHRCPFCHESIPAGAEEGVACLACSAPHHGECFVEGAGCAATACRNTTARVGHVEVPLEMLAEVLADPARLRELASVAPPTDLAARVLTTFASVGIFTVGSMMVAEMATGRPNLGLLIGPILGLFLAFLALRGTADRTVRLRRPDEELMDFDPIFGMWTGKFVPGTIPSALDAVTDKLRASAPPERPFPEGPPPTECPDCEQALEEEEATAFCYHCGTNLIDAAGGWRRAQDVRPPAPKVDQ